MRFLTAPVSASRLSGCGGVASDAVCDRQMQQFPHPDVRDSAKPGRSKDRPEGNWTCCSACFELRFAGPQHGEVGGTRPPIVRLHSESHSLSRR